MNAKKALHPQGKTYQTVVEVHLIEKEFTSAQSLDLSERVLSSRRHLLKFL